MSEGPTYDRDRSSGPGEPGRRPLSANLRSPTGYGAGSLKRWTDAKRLDDRGLLPVLAAIYADVEHHWDAYEMCEELIDIEENFQLWRFRHLKTVERMIGSRTGTGGSSGSAFLARALELTFFPELYAVRAQL